MTLFLLVSRIERNSSKAKEKTKISATSHFHDPYEKRGMISQEITPTLLSREEENQLHYRQQCIC